MSCHHGCIFSNYRISGTPLAARILLPLSRKSGMFFYSLSPFRAGGGVETFPYFPPKLILSPPPLSCVSPVAGRKVLQAVWPHLLQAFRVELSRGRGRGEASVCSSRTQSLIHSVDQVLHGAAQKAILRFVHQVFTYTMEHTVYVSM